MSGFMILVRYREGSKEMGSHLFLNTEFWVKFGAENNGTAVFLIVFIHSTTKMLAENVCSV